MNNYRSIRNCSALLLLLAQPSLSTAAPIVDSSSPTRFSAPTAAELANASDLVLNGFGAVPGSLVISLRSAPSNEINPGLDGPAPALVEGADTLEVGVVPVPEPSYACPLNTPVTITVSDWSITLLGASPGPVGAGGGGGALLDSNNLSPAAPATAATANGAPNPSTIGGTNVITQRQYVGTFADLPSLSFIATINAVRTALGSPVQSYYQAQVPSVTIEYDNAGCTAINVTTPAAVPAAGLAHLLLLCLIIPIIVRLRSLIKTARQ